MVNPRIKIATMQSVLSALLKVDDNGSPLHCCILFSAVWFTAETIGRAFIASFAFVLRATLSVAAPKAVGLSPYPYKTFRKDGYNDD